jgi:hypothetical protein
MATLMLASIIIRIPAPINIGGTIVVSKAALGIKTSAKDARMAPVRK